eukprot:TRINITY_DN2199_c0_g1_i2.p2 TRINITY_DN2199_c0_g1~~TRINITY_DN2199_c0_g1_i2.p2  ORF type:complete len:136 (+),score=31.48 TRINITY_DN2199_c0_g1_i2:740-1147(+)
MDVIKLLDKIIQECNIDEDRIYVTGLSMGGYGTWSIAMEYPDKFAAIAPVCGGGDATQVEKIKNVPVWIWHGDKDWIVTVKEAEDMKHALEACGGSVKYSLVSGADHGTVIPAAYENGDLYDWFLSHRRNTKNLV